MIITEREIPGTTELMLTATNEIEAEILHQFARLKEELSAAIEWDSKFQFPHIIIRKGKP